MKGPPMLRTFTGILVAALAASPTLAGPIGFHSTKHDVVRGGPIFDDVWISTGSWWGIPAALAVPDDPSLVTGWELSGSDVQTYGMFTADAMDSSMMPLFSRGIDDITHVAVQIQRSSADILPSLSLTILAETASGPQFSMRLADPIHADLTLRGFSPQPGGLFLAHYDGTMPEFRYLFHDPIMGPGEYEGASDGPGQIEVDVLTRIPAPGGAVALLCGLVPSRQRRRRGD